MQIQLTVPAATGHPVDAMLDCHERIRRFLDGARRLAALTNPLDPLAPGGAAMCARYFREGLPLHALDEDLTLAPRLRPRASPEVADALDRIAADHDLVDEATEALLPTLDAVAKGAPVPADLAERVERLAGILEPHLEVEEQVIFPAARAVLPAALLPEIRAEMAKRRR
jgi:hemerythrin-like domain-containing protein